MPYDYQIERPWIFTEQGQVMFLEIRDKINKLLGLSGAFTLIKAINNTTTGSTWSMIACVDRLVEIKELYELTTNGGGQNRVFVKYESWMEHMYH